MYSGTEKCFTVARRDRPAILTILLWSDGNHFLTSVVSSVNDVWSSHISSLVFVPPSWRLCLVFQNPLLFPSGVLSIQFYFSVHVSKMLSYILHDLFHFVRRVYPYQRTTTRNYALLTTCQMFQTTVYSSTYSVVSWNDLPGSYSMISAFRPLSYLASEVLLSL